MQRFSKTALSISLKRDLQKSFRYFSTISNSSFGSHQFFPTITTQQTQQPPYTRRHFATETEQETVEEEVAVVDEEVEEVDEDTEHQDAIDDDLFFKGPPAADRPLQHPDLYAAVDELILANETDVGKWFNVREELLLQHPLSSKWISKSVAELFEMSGNYLMLRQPMYDLISTLKDITDSPAAERGAVIGMYGARGAGKSVTLHSLNQAALQNSDKWLVIGFHARDVSADHFGFLFPDPTREGTHMQGRWCKDFFEKLIDTQGEVLKKVSLKRVYGYDWVLRGETGHLSEFEAEETKKQMDLVDTQTLAGKTLHDIATYGANDSTLAGECFYDFVEELILTDDIHTLVTLDGINLWDEKSEFRDPTNPFKKLQPRQLSAVNALSKFLTHAPKNGMSVFATTSANTQVMSKKYMKEADYALEIPVYSNKEISQAVWHYKVSRFVFAEVDVFLLAKIKGMTGGTPRDVFDDCSII